MIVKQSAKAYILIMDDVTQYQECLASVLRADGLLVEVVDAVERAMVHLDQAVVDLVIASAHLLPLLIDSDGDSLHDRLVAQHIPLIVMPSVPRAAVANHGCGGLMNVDGIVDYVTVPFTMSGIVARVIHNLQVRRGLIRLRQQVEEQERKLQRLERINHNLENANRALSRLANMDGLTQVANRYCFDEALSGEWRRLAREQQPLSLLLCDIDHFKAYNDGYGHLAGDECLRRVARALVQSARRPADLVARYGGEEFGVLLPNTNEKGLAHVAGCIMVTLEQAAIRHKYSPTHRFLTVSLGGHTVVPSLRQPPESLIEPSDKALYKAKHRGRNQFIAALN